MAVAPKPAETPLDLLTNNGLIDAPVINKYWGAAIGGSLSFVAVCFGNWCTKRPVLSGIQKHVIATVIGGGVCQYIDNMRNGYLAERDAVLRHYVQLHPEDFQPYERKTYSEVLESWVPIR